MTDNDRHMQTVEQRLGAVETGLSEVRGEVRELRKEVGGLRDEVNGLRILGEKNADDIKKIAEVQVHHGEKLDEITKALAPLADLRQFINTFAPDHEKRILALERHTGLRT